MIVRLANAWYVSLFGWSFTVPAWKHRAFIRSEAWDAGWRAGYQSGIARGRELASGIYQEPPQKGSV